MTGNSSPSRDLHTTSSTPTSAPTRALPTSNTPTQSTFQHTQTSINNILKAIQPICPLSSDLITARYGSVSLSDSQDFIVDSGATHHMTNSANQFAYLHQWGAVDPKHCHIHLADGSLFTIQGHGAIDITLGSTRIRLTDVLYVPDLKQNLFSIPQHTAYQGCALLAFDTSVLLSFPNPQCYH